MPVSTLTSGGPSRANTASSAAPARTPWESLWTVTGPPTLHTATLRPASTMITASETHTRANWLTG